MLDFVGDVGDRVTGLAKDIIVCTKVLIWNFRNRYNFITIFKM
jgi:hypothetical protein